MKAGYQLKQTPFIAGQYLAKRKHNENCTGKAGRIRPERSTKALAKSGWMLGLRNKFDLLFNVILIAAALKLS
jgi:hypothetical protein